MTEDTKVIIQAISELASIGTPLQKYRRIMKLIPSEEEALHPELGRMWKCPDCNGMIAEFYQEKYVKPQGSKFKDICPACGQHMKLT